MENLEASTKAHSYFRSTNVISEIGGADVSYRSSYSQWKQKEVLIA